MAPQCGDPIHHTFPFCPVCYEITRWSFTQMKAYDNTKVRALILADDFEQARAFARVNKFPLGEWEFISGPSVLDTYPNAKIYSVSAELYRPDLNRIIDAIFGACREIKYEGDE